MNSRHTINVYSVVYTQYSCTAITFPLFSFSPSSSLSLPFSLFRSRSSFLSFTHSHSLCETKYSQHWRRRSWRRERERNASFSYSFIETKRKIQATMKMYFQSHSLTWPAQVVSFQFITNKLFRIRNDFRLISSLFFLLSVDPTNK